MVEVVGWVGVRGNGLRFGMKVGEMVSIHNNSRMELLGLGFVFDGGL